MSLIPYRLEILPFPVLESICQYLAQSDTHRRSLFAFSLVSSRCCSASAAQRFERIKLRVRGGLQLRQDLEKWNGILGIEGRARHVRRIKVVGYMPWNGDGEVDRDPQLDAAEALEEEWQDDCEYESYEDNFVDPPASHIMFNNAMQQLDSDEAKHLHDEAWQPLATFINALPVLTDMVYSCLDQVAPCLLESLLRYHPHSRLHVHTFNLRSLCQFKDNLHDIDPAEFKLATHPCLYAISMLFSTGYDTYGHIDYNGEALFAMLSGMSPGLRNVRVWQSIPEVPPHC